MNSQVLNGTPITDTSLVDLCAFMNAASISNIPILLSAQSAGALVKAMTTSAPVQAQEPVANASADIFDLIRGWAHKPEGSRYEAARKIIGYINDTYTAGVSDGKFLGAAAPVSHSVAVPDGWKLVPAEPNDAMQAAGAQAVRIDTTVINKIWTGNAVFRAMIAAAPTAPAAQSAATQAATDVLAERRRQVDGEGMTNDADDNYTHAELPFAAAAYILNGSNDKAPAIWPWSKAWWKPRDNRANYVRAGALILAEIERLDRADAAEAVKS